MVVVLWLVLGAVIGAFLYHQILSRAPGRPVQTHQQAVYQRAGGSHLLDGPGWLSLRDSHNLIGIFDVSDKRLTVTVDPTYAILVRNEPDHGSRPDLDLGLDAPKVSRQRFYIEIAIVYRPVDMVAVLRLGDDLDEWMASHVRAAVRSHALTQRWDPQDDGEQYSAVVRQRLAELQEQRGIQLIEVYCERVGVHTAGELASQAKASSARSLGREGLVLTYLETLKEMANSPSTTILLPTEMSGDPDAVLKAAKHDR